MKKYIYIFLILIIQTAQAQQCRDLFTTDQILAVRNTHIDWAQELSEMPYLKDLLQKYIDDPDMPLKLKYMLQKAFVSNDVEIRNFTKEIKKQYSFDPNTLAFAGDLKPKYIVKKQNSKNKNTQLSKPADSLYNDKKASEGWFQDRYFIAVEDSSIYLGENPLLIFMHEMAHVRFHVYLSRHISDLIGKFPTDLVSKNEKNEVVIDSDLLDYLNERYAHETEFTVLKSILHTKNMFLRPNRWNKFIDLPQNAHTRQKISAMIRERYGLHDERLAYLDQQKISSILLNGLDQKYWHKSGFNLRQLLDF